MSELPWFGQFREMRGHPYPVYPGHMTPQIVQTPMQGPMYSGNVVYQQPGHDVVIQDGNISQGELNLSRMM